MKIFVKTREAIALRSVKRKKKNLIRNRRVHNFSTAKTVGIYFESKDAGYFNSVWKFSKNLEKDGIKSSLLGFVDDDEIPGEMSARENCVIFLRKQLDWAYRPKLEEVSNFTAKEFDILFDFSLKDTVPGFYIHTLSKAQFKVGRFRESENDIDLMIDTHDNNSIDYLIEQIKTYISMLNKQEKTS